jgi:hypothetical protein
MTLFVMNVVKISGVYQNNMLFVIMLGVIMLSFFMPNVVMLSICRLSDIMPSIAMVNAVLLHCHYDEFLNAEYRCHLC